MVDFQQALRAGHIGENIIILWLLSQGYCVLPIYGKENSHFQGPRLYLPHNQAAAAPDIMAFKDGKVYWIESKLKTAFCFFRKTGQWTTGIDQKSYDAYLKVTEETKIPVLLMFLHLDGTAKDTPEGETAPTGLFGGEITRLNEELKTTDNIWHNKWGERGGKGGMVYWGHKSLTPLATLDDLNNINNVNTTSIK